MSSHAVDNWTFPRSERPSKPAKNEIALQGWLADILRCPRDRTPLTAVTDDLICSRGHAYSVCKGIPVFLLAEDFPYHPRFGKFTLADLDRFAAGDDGATPPPSEVHPYVREYLHGSSGRLYDRVRGSIDHYPIPKLRLPEGNDQTFLDIGCHWGRWAIASARMGYKVAAIDPNFEALVVARRVCRQLRVDATFLCADARYLPFANGTFDVVHSYSVLQHLDKRQAKLAIQESGRVSRATTLIQMANCFGIRSLYHQARRLGRKPSGFAVRYWTPGELRKVFNEIIGPSELMSDGFFGLGVGAANASDLMRPQHRLGVRISNRLRNWPALTPLADSVYVRSAKANTGTRASTFR